jgi:hypothetical protein
LIFFSSEINNAISMPNPEKPMRKGFNPNAAIEIQLIESHVQLIEL